MQGFIGEVRMFGGNFAPRNWAFCEGQLLPISSNTALFSILGTTFGGDGRTTFGLPDNRGRTAIGEGNGPGLSGRALGQKLGTETNTLNQTHIPNHSHNAVANMLASSGNGDTGEADGNNLAHQARGNTVPNIYNNTAPSIEMHSDSIAVAVGHTGNGQAMNNLQPILAVRYIICLMGTYPSRS